MGDSAADQQQRIVGDGSSPGDQGLAAGQDQGQQNQMSFRDKRKFFEQEIAAQQTTAPPADSGSRRRFSYLQEHEVAKMKIEDGKSS